MYQSDLQLATDLLVNDLLKTKKGEVFVITADTETDRQVVEFLSRSATMAGAKALIAWVATPLSVSEAADVYLPLEPLCGLLEKADIWVELNVQWLLYSTPYYFAMKNNQNLRHFCLTGANAQTMIRCVGQIDYPAMRRFSRALHEKIKKAKRVDMIAPSGAEISFENVAGRPISCKLGQADRPGTHLFVGQISWTPALESINGTIVLDGSVAPDIGLIHTPIKIHVQQGKIVSLSGGKEAQAYESWLRSFHHPQMLSVAHAGIGFNPGASLAGDILQDQRVWGSTTWGFGSIGAGLLPPNGIPAPSHSDAVSLNTSIILDGEALWINGEVVSEDLQEDAKRIKRAC
ncbi:aminopeptidase [Candidatus Formimonas warabiya]|uniref:Leucyl aminopeptidase n=1 Tax=Formimonas warabiya TaxID=1761012 RepID=A0A3G1KS67_FORW1|nr:aminopeptidase [Candidatus Formimonas warabiya]ATW25342.1 leucyl aminopeptidase [Candidatus Formimonas warabiya]